MAFPSSRTPSQICSNDDAALLSERSKASADAGDIPRLVVTGHYAMKASLDPDCTCGPCAARRSRTRQLAEHLTDQRVVAVGMCSSCDRFMDYDDLASTVEELIVAIDATGSGLPKNIGDEAQASVRLRKETRNYFLCPDCVHELYGKSGEH